MTRLVNTAGKIVAFVEIPENADQFYIPINGTHVWYKVNDKPNFNTMLTDGRWQILGDSRTLTEEQMKEICDFSEMAAEGIDDHEGGYLCYVRGYWHHKTVQESYLSLKEANGIVDSIGKEPDQDTYMPGENFTRKQQDEYWKAKREWDERKSLVKRFLVLVSQE